MRKTVFRSLLFAAAVVAVSLVVDSLFTLLTRAGTGGQFFVFRVALHGATFVFAAAGAAAGFAFLGGYSIRNAHIVSMGATLGLFTAAVALMAVEVGAYWSLTAWLLVTSALVSLLGGKVLGTTC